jgi:hypothetical protein
VASAGSCFANALATSLAAAGVRYPVYEPGAEPLAARYGNIYTTLQLRQLLDRALGRFVPVERAWPTPHGRWLDPFRPVVDRDGFTTVPALERAREHHLAAVREMFERSDVFFFTMVSPRYGATRATARRSRSHPGEDAASSIRSAMRSAIWTCTPTRRNWTRSSPACARSTRLRASC